MSDMISIPDADPELNRIAGGVVRMLLDTELPPEPEIVRQINERLEAVGRHERVARLCFHPHNPNMLCIALQGDVTIDSVAQRLTQ